MFAGDESVVLLVSFLEALAEARGPLWGNRYRPAWRQQQPMSEVA